VQAQEGEGSVAAHRRRQGEADSALSGYQLIQLRIRHMVEKIFPRSIDNDSLRLTDQSAAAVTRDARTKQEGREALEIECASLKIEVTVVNSD
jgi:hypothetical protein